MKKQIDRMQRRSLTNAFSDLEDHGIVDHANFFTKKDGMEVWAYIIGNKSVRITQIDKTTYELEVINNE